MKYANIKERLRAVRDEVRPLVGTMPMGALAHLVTVRTARAWRDELGDIVALFELEPEGADNESDYNKEATIRMMMLSEEVAATWNGFAQDRAKISNADLERVTQTNSIEELLNVANDLGILGQGPRNQLAAEPFDNRPLDDRLPSRDKDGDEPKLH